MSVVASVRNAVSSASELVRATRMISVVIERELAADDLLLDDWLVMEALVESPGLTMAELKDYTLSPAATMTRVVDRLVSRSVVFRLVDGDDRRKVRVNLSKRGIALHARLAPAIHQAEQDWFAAR